MCTCTGARGCMYLKMINLPFIDELVDCTLHSLQSTPIFSFHLKYKSQRWYHARKLCQEWSRWYHSWKLYQGRSNDSSHKNRSIILAHKKAYMHKHSILNCCHNGNHNFIHTSPTSSLYVLQNRRRLNARMIGYNRCFITQKDMPS